MIPQKLMLKGFLSYLDETSLDLTAVNVACVSGANGAGKSSLFDAITWVLFGKARRSDDALINDGADACLVALEFEYENSTYRVQRQKTREKGAMLEFHIRSEDDTWRTLTEAGLRATEERIRDILHLDYDTFINASFFLQDKADMFTQQTPSRRKEILGSILGLDIWETYREETALRRRNAAAEVKGLRTWLDEIVEELNQESERRERLQLLKSNLKKSEALRLEKEKQWSVAKQQDQELRTLKEKLALIETQISSAKNRLEHTDTLIAARTKEARQNLQLLDQEKQIDKDYKTWRTLQAELERWNKLSNTFHQLQSQRAELTSRVGAEEARLQQEMQNLLQEQRTVHDDVLVQLPQLKAQLEKLNHEQQEVENETAELPQLEKYFADLQDKRSILQAENSILKKRMNEIKERLNNLESAAGSSCPLCGQELNDDHLKEITGKYNLEGAQLGDQFRKDSQKLTEIDGEIPALSRRITDLRGLLSSAGARQKNLGSLNTQINEFQKRLEKWEAAGKPRLQQLESVIGQGSFLPQEQGDIRKLDESIVALGYDEQVHQLAITREASCRQAEELFERLKTARTTQEGLKRELESLAHSQASIHEELHAQNLLSDEFNHLIREKEKDLPDINWLEAELNKMRLEENQLRQESGAAQQMVDVLETQRLRQTDLSERVDILNRDITQLNILEAAFSKDGVPALLIEQALPEIETQANLILDRLSDGRMSVNFETEREYKDKRRDDKRQTLDILISDSSGRREYELFSGGEAFRINFAIRLALSRVLASRAGARLQTLVIDEGFGSQDAEGRQRLVEAINLVSPEFSKILVITHLDELKDAFPSRIEVQKTERGSTVEVIA